MVAPDQPGGEGRRGAWRARSGPPRRSTSPSTDARWRQRRPSRDDVDFARQKHRLFVRRVGFSGAALLLVVLLVVLLLGMKRQVPLIAGVVSSYRPPLGPLASAEEDRRVLAALSRGGVFDPGTARVEDISIGLIDADADQFVTACAEKLERVRPGGPGRGAIIVHLTAIGGVDRDGRACLIPARGAGIFGDDRRWLRVETLLEKLAESRPSGAALVVVLDACRPAHGESVGILDGAFAAALAVDVVAANHERLWVLASAGPGETACVAPGDAGSVFTTAFADALEGVADARPWGDDDGRVELAELATYLGDEVDRRAVVYHGKRQRPFIVPTPREGDRDVGIAWTVRRQPATSVVASDVLTPSRLEWLGERWSKARLLRERSVHERPLGWALYEALLLRAERLCSAGAGVDAQLQRVKAAVESAEQALAIPLVSGKMLPGVRLARLADGATRTSDKNWLDSLDNWARTVSDPVVGDTEAAPPAPCTDDAEWRGRAEAAWKTFADLAHSGATISREAWRRWNDLVGTPAADGKLPPNEIQAARLLYRGVDDETWQSASALLSRVAALADDAATATLADDVRADALIASTAPSRDADVARREAFDHVVVGDEVPLAKATAAARKATERYEKAAEAGRTASDAWRLLDRVRAEWPWLAIWHASIAQPHISTEARGTTLRGDWRKLSVAVARLEQTLNATPEPGAGAAAVAIIADAAAETAESFALIRDSYDAACDSLAERAATNATTLAEIRAVLAAPLVDDDRRMQLIRRAMELSAELMARTLPAGRDRPAPGEPQTAEAVACWVPWQGKLIHPFVAATGVGDGLGTSPPASLADVAAATGAWGHAIREAGAALPQVASETAAGEIATAAAATRRLAPLGPGTMLDDASAVAELTAVATHLREAWHARLVRVASSILDDFHAGVEPEDPAWFSLAAAACLERAAELGSGSEFDRVAKRLDVLASTSDDWAALQNSPERLGIAGDGGSTLIKSTLVLDDRVADAVAPGDAALWLTDGSSAEPVPLLSGSAVQAASRRQPVPVARPAADGRPQSAAWRADRTAASRLEGRKGGTMPVAIWFRGHRMLRDLPVGGGDSLQPLVWRPTPPLPPRVTVRGSQKRNGYVTFVFDCSGSMGKPKGNPKFPVAQRALQDVIAAMGKSNAWNASLWVYGHRTRWIPKPGGGHDPGLSSAGERERFAAEQAGRPFLLLPGDDVDCVQSMSPLGAGRVREFNGLLADLMPSGETPLYLAMCRSLETDASAVPGDAEWRVIVVTDGRNDQTKVKDQENMKRKADVQAILETINAGRPASPVHIDLLAFDLRDADELRDLAKDSGGKYFEAADSAALTRALRDALRLQRWEIVDSTDAARGKAELGGSIDLPPVVGERLMEYTVRLEDRPEAASRIVVGGGESLELFVTADGRGLEHRRYDGGTEQGFRGEPQQHLGDPLDEHTQWFVAAHLPKREGSSVRFPISLQNQDETRFTPRPVACWVEIVPEGGADARPFIFFDTAYQPRRPVPVLDLVVPEWPRDATRAAIRAWFSTQAPEPAAEIPVEQLTDGSERRLTFPGLPGVGVDAVFKQLSPDLARVTVVERHPPDAAQLLPRLRVLLGPGCSRSAHVVDVAAAEVRHEFDLRLDAGAIPPGTRISFAAADRFKERAVAPRAPGGSIQPIRLTIPND